MWLWHKSYGLNGVLECLIVLLGNFEKFYIYTNYSSVIFILYYYYHVILILMCHLSQMTKMISLNYPLWPQKNETFYFVQEKVVTLPGSRYFLFIINIIDLSFTGVLYGTLNLILLIR